MTSKVELRSAIEHELEWKKCEADPEYFIDHYCYMWEKAGGDPIPFKLWECQRETIRAFESNEQLIILKTRQLGESWVIDGYSLWCAVFKPNVHIYIRSIGLKEATEQHERIKFMYDNLPDWLRDRVTLGGKGKKRNDTKSEFSNGSAIHMLASSKKSGHGSSPYLVFWDEAARDENASKAWGAIKPSIANGGRVVIVSTSDGPNNLFSDLWHSAEKGETSFKTLFFPASAHPAYTPEFLEKERRDYEAINNMAEYYAAYPAFPEQAFQASSRCPFESSRLEDARKRAENPRRFELEMVDTTVTLEAKATGRFMVWEEPKKGASYTLGADVAGGLTNGDFSAFVVICNETNRVVALFRSHVAPEVYAYHIEAAARYYNDAFVGVEINKFDCVMQDLKQTYSNLYMREQRDKPWDTPTFAVGWATTAKSKKELVTSIRREFHAGGLYIPSTDILNEMSKFEERENGTFGGAQKEHDDCVMALGIALAIRSAQSRRSLDYDFEPPDPRSL